MGLKVQAGANDKTPHRAGLLLHDLMSVCLSVSLSPYIHVYINLCPHCAWANANRSGLQLVLQNALRPPERTQLSTTALSHPLHASSLEVGHQWQADDP